MILSPDIVGKRSFDPGIIIFINKKGLSEICFSAAIYSRFVFKTYPHMVQKFYFPIAPFFL